MSKVKFVLNRAGVREILQSPEIAAAVKDYTNQVQGRAGAGYEASVMTKNRAVGRVTAETREAKRDNSKNNTLLKALGGNG